MLPIKSNYNKELNEKLLTIDNFSSTTSSSSCSSSSSVSSIVAATALVTAATSKSINTNNHNGGVGNGSSSSGSKNKASSLHPLSVEYLIGEENCICDVVESNEKETEMRKAIGGNNYENNSINNVIFDSIDNLKMAILNMENEFQNNMRNFNCF